MQLLYCRNGSVIGWNDSAQNIPASAFGTGVRIIPYDQSVKTLPRIGDPPPFNMSWSDTRPYEQPTETPELLVVYAGQKRWETSTAGITFTAASGPVPLKCDRVSQTLVANLAQYAETLAPTAAVDFTQDGVHYPLQASEAVAMFKAMNDQIQQGRTIEAQCIADLTSATPTILTYDDVDAKFAGLVARTLRGKK